MVPFNLGKTEKHIYILSVKKRIKKGAIKKHGQYVRVLGRKLLL